MGGEGAAGRARRLRRRSTGAERALWARLRDQRLRGVKFRRQAPIGAYIVDFATHEARLIVELDGGQHLEQREYDERRTRWLESQGYRVLRFWNGDALTRTDSVVEAILLALGDVDDAPT